MNYSLYEMLPEIEAQIKLLPELELLMGNGKTLKFKLSRRDHSRPYKVKYRDAFNIGEIS